MKKFKNIGLSAMVAFTMMFATTVVVAQEKVVAASDDMEVKESVEASVLSETLEELSGTPKLTKKKLRNSYTWIFEGDDTNITDHEQYTRVNDEPENCEPGDQVPCYIVVDAEDEGDLEALFLNLTEGQIMGLAPEKRNP